MADVNPIVFVVDDDSAVREVTASLLADLGDEVGGAIVGLDVDEVVIARYDPRAGRVHVHFPRMGFHIKAIKKELA